MGQITAGEAKKHYDPLPAQYLRFNGELYCYNFSKLKFEQVILAEETGNLQKIRVDNFGDDPSIPASYMNYEYVADLASILFVPAPNRKAKIFSQSMMAKTRKDFMATENPDNYEKAQRCLRDFFIRRSKRTVASTTLTHLGNTGRVLSRMSRLASTYSKSLSKEKGSTTQESGKEESRKGSEARQSNS